MSDPESFRPKPTVERAPAIKEGQEAKRLPEELDKPGTLFAYGYLLDQSKLRELLNTRRPDFPIHETTDMEEARRLAKDQGAIVILRNVRMEGVRVNVVSEQWLRDEYAKAGGSVEALVEEGVLTQESTHGGLYARTTSPDEKFPRYLNGGLVCGFTPEEIERLDKFEMVPVYKQERVPSLTILNETYIPKHVNFYAASLPVERDEAEKQRLRALRKRPEPGKPSPNLKYPRGLR